MRREELDTLVGWAAAEGWNPGLGDATLFWDTDPEGFVAAEAGDQLVGGGSIVSYDGLFGFMGFFIVDPAWRGRGIGTRLWHHRRDTLRARLRPGAAIGMDGVPAMQPFYRRGGFVSAGTDVRFEGPVRAATGGAVTPGLVDAREVPLHDLAAYDAAHFPAPRPDFVRRWITQPGARALAAPDGGGGLRGYGVVRPCGRGHKVGPLFADDAATAEAILDGLAAHAASATPAGATGSPLVLDVPDTNPTALALARDRGMEPVFECARMYLGPAPGLPIHEVFGVTTFELG